MLRTITLLFHSALRLLSEQDSSEFAGAHVSCDHYFRTIARLSQVLIGLHAYADVYVARARALVDASIATALALVCGNSIAGFWVMLLDFDVVDLNNRMADIFTVYSIFIVARVSYERLAVGRRNR
eukprot:SAG11_NODE_12_length_27025_cov_37.402681_13_plen_126_part_00